MLADVGCRWLLLTADGSCWLLLAPVGCRWLMLAADGCCWLLLAPVGSCWLLIGKLIAADVNEFNVLCFIYDSFVGL